MIFIQCFVGLVVGIFGGAIVGAMVAYFSTPLAGIVWIGSVVLCTGWPIFQKMKEAEAERLARESYERKRRDQDRAAEQKRLADAREAEQKLIRDAEARKQRLRYNLSVNMDVAQFTLEELPRLLRSADGDLNLAENEFTEKAAISFWDAVERATNSLARYQAGLQQITDNGNSYAQLRNELGEPVPPFNLDLTVLPNTSPTTQRLRRVARKGETDLAFAQIYVQMRTNKILVDGFSTLGSAISVLGDRIENSFANLCNVVEFSAASQTEAINARQSEIAETERHHRDQIAADQIKESQALNKSVQEMDAAARQAAGEQAKRDKDADEKLDYIQKGRKPFGWGDDDDDKRREH